MKRLLLTTTAITCLAASSFAEMSAKLHGKYEAQAGSRSGKSAYVNAAYLTTNQKNFKLNSTARVGVLLESKTEHGMKYGANIMLMPRNQDDARYASNTEKSFLFLEHKFGRMELGSNFDVGTMMNLGASSIASATGGASDGDWSNYLPNPTLNDGALNPMTYGVSFMYRYSRTNTESERKISYMTPVFEGVQFGLSYTPDAANNGTTAPTSVTSFKSLKDVTTLALAYSKEVAGMDFGASVSYDTGATSNANLHKLSDYNIGAKLGKDGYSVAASYGDAGKSLQTTMLNNVKYKANYYTVGVAYTKDKMSASLTYLGSQLGSQDNTLPSFDNVTKLSAYTLGADYMLAAGLKLYGEVTAFAVSNPAKQQTMGAAPQSTAPLPKNNGTVIIVGAAVKF